MKKALVIATVVLLSLASKIAFAAEGGEKGASQEAYEHANEQAIFHRVSDWFASIGKSPEEKAKMLKERRAKRAAKRAQKEIRKSQRKMERIKEQEGSPAIRERQKSRQRPKTRTRQRTRTR